MELKIVDPRSLKPNPDNARRSKSNPQADALLLATIKAVGIVQPPVVIQESGGGNGYIINSGHRRVDQAVAAGLEEITVLVADPAEDGGFMRSMVENIAREPINPVDQWRAIERLVALGWTEEAIGVALALPVRQIRKLRLLANILPAMLDQMMKGDMPGEQHLRTIAAASLEEQKQVWKKHKPSKSDPRASWWDIARALTKTRMFARDASFGEDLREAYGIVWQEDLFAPADEDSRYTTDVEAFLGAQQEFMTNNLPKRGIIAEAGSYGDVKLPAKAQRVYGKPSKSDYTAMYLDNNGKVQSVHYRMPQLKKAKEGHDLEQEEIVPVVRTRPEVTQNGVAMIGDFRTDALHDALSRAPIEDDTLTALLVLALAGQNVSVVSPNSGTLGYQKMNRFAAELVSETGMLDYDMDTLRRVVRLILIEVLSCRENRTNSGIPALIAGQAIGVDGFLPNMGTDDFLSCLSRPALEAACKEASVLPRQKVKDTRAALVEHFREGRFIHDKARFVPDEAKLATWRKSYAEAGEDDAEDQDAAGSDGTDAVHEEHEAPSTDATTVPIDPDPVNEDDLSGTAPEPDRLAA